MTQLGEALLVADKAPPKYRPAHYAYIMPESQQRRVLAQAPTLKVGSSVDEIVEKLGPPSRDEMMYPKDPKRPPSRYMQYYFARRDLNLVNIYDPSIQLFFDQQQRLRSLASNVPGIPSLNWNVTESWEEPSASQPDSGNDNR